jgi:hypothetical protein
LGNLGLRFAAFLAFATLPIFALFFLAFFALVFLVLDLMAMVRLPLKPETPVSICLKMGLLRFRSGRLVAVYHQCNL